MAHFDLKQLRHFVSVVDEGSITQASRVQHITQPALTRSIRNMEDRVGGALLIRNSRAVVPTEAGLALYQYAQMIIRQSELAMRDVTAISRGEKGQVHIGVGALFAPSLIRHLIPDVSERFPGLHIRITEGFFEDLISGLSRGDIDLIISNFPPGLVPRNALRKPLFRVLTEFVVGSGHPFAAADTITTTEMREAEWAIVKQPHIVSFLEEYFANASLPPLSVAVETSSLATLKDLVLTDRFVAMLPRLWIEEEIREGRITILPGGGGSLVREAGLMWRGDGTRRPSCEAVLPVIEESCLRWYEGVRGAS